MAKFIPPKKSLGQNFLKDDNISKKIVSLLQIEKNDIIMEIGPGTGALTGHLLSSPASAINAIEIDNRAIEILQSKFSEFIPEKLSLHNLDFRKINPLEVIRDSGTNIKVIGNIPYYISGEIIFFILDNYARISKAVLTVQKEVAQRLASQSGSKIYGIPAVMASLVGKARSAFDILPGAFYPPPKVKSSVVEIDITKHDYDIEKYLHVKKIVRSAFNQRRKKLINSISTHLEGIAEIMPEIKDLLDKRAENLTSKDYETIESFIFSNKY